MRAILLATLLAAGVVLGGCGPHNTAARVPPAPTPSPSPDVITPPKGAQPPAISPKNVPPVRPGPIAPGEYVEEGMASWYGVPYHGRRAADGEIYDMYKLTAAHRTLPFNTVVRVTNIVNGEHVDLRITDRGPFVEDRIIDLSLAGARAIDMVATGTARVRVEIISGATPPSAGRFAVQVGAFADRANAERLRAQLAVTYQLVSIHDFTGPNGLLYRVRVGDVGSESAAQQLAAKVQKESGLSTFVVRLDDVQQGSSSGGGMQP